MYFTSSIADDIRVPLQINIVCLVLLQPRRRTPHRSCSNDGTILHSRALPSVPYPEASDLLPRLRQSHQHHHLHVQPNDVEVHKAMPKRLYTRRITLLLCIHVDPSGILCYGPTIRANLLEGVEQSKTGGFFSFGVSFEEKM